MHSRALLTSAQKSWILRLTMPTTTFDYFHPLSVLQHPKTTCTCTALRAKVCTFSAIHFDGDVAYMYILFYFIVQTYVTVVRHSERKTITLQWCYCHGYRDITLYVDILIILAIQYIYYIVLLWTAGRISLKYSSRCTTVTLCRRTVRDVLRYTLQHSMAISI